VKDAVLRDNIKGTSCIISRYSCTVTRYTRI